MKIKKATPIKWKTIARRINSSSFASGREGVYMGYCKPFIKPEVVCSELVAASSGSKKFSCPGGTSGNCRVIAKVFRFKITGEPMQPHWYCPRVSAVTHAFLEGQWVEIDPKQIEWE